jgi:hypothetical protein
MNFHLIGTPCAFGDHLIAELAKFAARFRPQHGGGNKNRGGLRLSGDRQPTEFPIELVGM